MHAFRMESLYCGVVAAVEDLTPGIEAMHKQGPCEHIHKVAFISHGKVKFMEQCALS